MENSVFDSKPYKNARISYIINCAVLFIVELLCEDAFMSKLLISLGLTGSQVGLLSSIISLAFLIQILSIPLLMKQISFKKTSVFFDLFGVVIFAVLYLLPFFRQYRAVRVLAFVLMLLGYFSRQLVSSIVFRWANLYVHPAMRGSYSATKESISLVVGIVFTLSISYMFDSFERAGKTDTAFLIFAVSILACSVISFCCYMIIPEGNLSASSGHTIKQILKNTLGNKNYRPALVLSILWSIGKFFTYGYIGVFKTESLGLTLFQIQLINTASFIVRLFASKPFGCYTDKHSFAKGMGLGLVVATTAFACVVFTNQKTWYLIIAFTILYAISMAGINQNYFNIMYSYVDKDFITEALAIRGAICGTLGFASAALAKKLFEVVEARRGIFGIAAYPQQVLAVVTCIILCAAFLYDKFVVQKIKIAAL